MCYFIDHEINSIQNYIAPDTREKYQMIDVNVYQENVFHTKMLLKDFELDDYVFGKGVHELDSNEQEKIEEQLKKEMSEIFYGINSLD